MVSVVSALASVLTGVATVLMAPAVASAEERVLCEVTDPRLTEISGMTASALHPRVMWLHNDSGDAARLYAVDLTDCTVVGEVTLKNVDARDFEGIATGVDPQGRPVLWVGDIGDNLDSWENVSLYRVREPRTLGKKSVRAVRFRFTYQDRPHNAETILADPDSPQVWIVTKQLASGSIYALPRTLSRSQINIAEKVGRVGGLVTDGSMNPQGTGFVLRDYFDAHVYSGQPPGELVDTYALPAQIQGEAIAFTADGSALVIASENDSRLIQIEVPGSEPLVDEPGKDPVVEPRVEPEGGVTEPTSGDVNYTPLVVGVVGGIALVTGLILMSRKPRDRAIGSTKKAE